MRAGSVSVLICSLLSWRLPVLLHSMEHSSSLPTVNSPGELLFPLKFQHRHLVFPALPLLRLDVVSLLCDFTAPLHSFAMLHLSHCVVVVYLLVSLFRETLNTRKTGAVSCLSFIPQCLIYYLRHSRHSVAQQVNERVSEWKSGNGISKSFEKVKHTIKCIILVTKNKTWTPESHQSL